jgi:hypothetical protein
MSAALIECSGLIALFEELGGMRRKAPRLPWG